jgi:hypothetical protein
MRTLRVFRPNRFDFLEDRAVPASAPTIVLFEPVFAVPVQVGNLQQVKVAFATFLADYELAISEVLLAPAPDGSINPAANHAAFNQRVDIALSQLDNSVVSAVSTADLPDTPAVISDVQQAIFGDSPESLANRLAALPLPPNTPPSNGQSSLVASPNEIVQAIRSSSVAAQAQARANAVPSGTELANSISGGGDSAIISASATAGINGEVRQAYSAFLQGYFRAVQHVLLAPGADGTVNPAANRAAFNTRVAAALQSLNHSVAAAVSHVPQATALTAKTRQALVGNDANTLQSQLAALPNPAIGQGAVALFGFDSTKAIGNSLALLMGEIAAYVRGTGSGR